MSALTPPITRLTSQCQDNGMKMQLCTEMKENVFLFSVLQKSRINDPSANNPPKGQRPKEHVKEILQHFYAELELVSFAQS